MLIERFAAWVRGRTGWQQPALASVGGVVSVLAMAPFHAWPVLGLTLPALIWQIDGALAREPGAPWRRKPAARAALVGWWFGFGYFFAGLFWIGEAFLVEAEKFAALIPLAVTSMPAGLALFWAGAAAIASLAWRPGLQRVVALALALGAAEWLRGHVFTGFPWNVIGYALTYPESLMQAAGLIGIYGLSVVAVLALAAPLVALADGAPARGAALALGLVGGLVAYGHWWLAGPAPAAADGPRVRLIQPSVPQREKWRPEHQRRIFELHLALTTRNAAGEEDGAAGIDLVIWPEAAMPFLPLDAPEAIERIGKILPAGTHLIAGGLRAEPPDSRRPEAHRRVYNSLIAFGREGRAVAIYDKIHLVPFGEYLPLNAVLDAIGLEPLTRRRGGFTPGPNPRPLMTLPRIGAFAPLICYEAIFPRAIVQGGERPSFLVNVTNDGWFGNTTGPRQHLHQARVRAVEEGLPLVRVANNGITAVIDGRGHIRHRLDLDVVGVIDAAVPPPMPPTLYSRFGDLWFALMLLVGVATVFAGRPFRARTGSIS
ncbi:MAG: apolipoprotein N-acyltransferase [Hyphomicrobiaceae bacterium]